MQTCTKCLTVVQSDVHNDPWLCAECQRAYENKQRDTRLVALELAGWEVIRAKDIEGCLDSTERAITKLRDVLQAKGRKLDVKLQDALDALGLSREITACLRAIRDDIWSAVDEALRSQTAKAIKGEELARLILRLPVPTEVLVGTRASG